MVFFKIYTPTSLAIVNKLLEIEAIQLNDNQPFVWSSGWKSPIYCDNRLSLSYPAIRKYIKNALVSAIGEHFQDTEYIAGVATAGIPHGALVADALELPYVYVRSTSKGHGLRNRIEGKIDKGKQIVLVEDLVSTGESVIKAADALVEAGFKVIGIVAIFTYGLAVAKKNLQAANIPLVCLSDFDHLLAVSEKNKHLDEQQIIRLKSWKLDPANWG